MSNLTTDLLSDAIVATGGTVDDLPDNLKTTLLKRLAGEVEVADNLETTLLKAVITNLENGTGGGGSSGETIGTADTLSSFTGMLYALTSGNYKSGEFTLSSLLDANTETLIFQTGLSEIKRLLIIADNFPQVTDESTLTRVGMFFYAPEWKTIRSDGHYSYRLIRNGTVSNTGTIWLTVNDSYRVENGDFYATAKYKNNSYTPFPPGVSYTWIAW